MNKKFELSTLLGITASLCLIIAAITLGNQAQIGSYFDMPAILIVFGGTFFVTCASYTIGDVLKALSISGQTLFYTSADKRQIVANCVRLAEKSKREGILSMQKSKDLYRNMNEFFVRHLNLIIDGLGAGDAEKIMVQEILSIRDRHKKASEILRKAAEVAPSMGLIGTLIGLVQMLGNLNDPSKIGPAMAVALLTTLYGAIAAFVILTPLSQKLEKNSKDEIELLKIYGDAIIAIAKQEGPIRLEMKMNAALSPEDRVKIFS